MVEILIGICLLATPAAPAQAAPKPAEAQVKEQLRASFTRVEGELKKAREAKDSLKASCIESKLLEMKRLAREAFVTPAADAAPAVDPALKRALAKERIDLLAIQASECIGAERLGATETKVSASEGAGNASPYDAVQSTTPSLPLSRPPAASPTE